ncbi:hypothetical protein BY996DRAFT_6408978 [Phakopsora pachyrhizi]|nr:hypothetical protein BY996DRAFT_6408978 [Phakopsora pachyrhizi]
MDDDDEPLHSSDCEFQPPQKLLKKKNHTFSSGAANYAILSSSSQNATTPKASNQSFTFSNNNLEFFSQENNQSEENLGSLNGVQPFRLSSSNIPDTINESDSIAPQSSSCLSTTDSIVNIGENPVELLVLSLEAKFSLPPNQKSFIRELALVKSNAERHAALINLLSNVSHKLDQNLDLENANFVNSSYVEDKMFLWSKPPKVTILNFNKSYVYKLIT